jgi:putative endonuclease
MVFLFMATVYVIRSQEGYIYTGCTEDFEHRLYQHNNHLSGWTKRGVNWKPIHTEEYNTLSEARKRERWLKTGKGREFIKSIIEKSS